MNKGEQENEYEEITRHLDYYTLTEEGRQQLEEISRKRERIFIEELFKYYRPERNIIWMSSYCESCIYYTTRGGNPYCSFNESRLVKPFHGRAILKLIKDELDRIVSVEVRDIDWDGVWQSVDDEIIRASMEGINGGRPYDCFMPAINGD